MSSSGIRKLPSGRWQARITTPEGKQVGLGTFGTKAEAVHARIDKLAEIQRGTWSGYKKRKQAQDAAKSITLRELSERYNSLGTRGGKPLSPRTLAEYKRYIERDLASMAGLPIAQISKTTVEDWWAKMGVPKKEGKAPPYTLRQRVYSYLHSLMKYAEDGEYIERNPCRIRGAMGGVQPKPLSIPTEEQVQAIIQFAPEHLRALFAIAASAGLRKGELLELRVKDVSKLEDVGLFSLSITRAVIWVDGEPQVREPKWSSVRKVILDQRASEELRAQLSRRSSIDPEALLFTEKPTENMHFSEHRLNRIFDKLRKAVDYRGPFHSLRHYAGTQWVLKGGTLVETLERLGHSNFKTGLRYQQNTHREIELLTAGGTSV